MAAAAILKKFKLSHISAAVRAMSTKFGTATQFDLLDRSKSNNRDISATVWPITTKFGMMTQFDTHDTSDR